MNSLERVKRAIEFQGPDRLPIAGNCMRYAPQGDVVYHFPNMRGVAWWLGDGGWTGKTFSILHAISGKLSLFMSG